MTKPWYDNLDCLGHMLEKWQLHGLRTIVQARRTAGYSRDEVLDPVIMAQRWISDSRGNLGFIEQQNLAFEPPPGVITFNKYYELCTQLHLPAQLRYVIGNYQILPHDLVCAYCQKPWTLENLGKQEGRYREIKKTLDQFVGKNLAHVTMLLNTSTTRHHLAQVHNLQNAIYVDLTPYPSLPKLVINEEGWITVNPRAHQVESGDVALYQVWQWYHTDCYATVLAIEEQLFFEEAFTLAGFATDTVLLRAIPNQYWLPEYGAAPPWFQVTTPLCSFVVGHRKHVIHLGWGEKPQLYELFAEENTTLYPSYIHARDKQQLIDYLTRIRLALATD